jgi:hypothetical protein
MNGGGGKRTFRAGGMGAPAVGASFPVMETGSPATPANGAPDASRRVQYQNTQKKKKSITYSRNLPYFHSSHLAQQHHREMGQPAVDHTDVAVVAAET